MIGLERLDNEGWINATLHQNWRADNGADPLAGVRKRKLLGWALAAMIGFGVVFLLITLTRFTTTTGSRFLLSLNTFLSFCGLFAGMCVTGALWVSDKEKIAEKEFAQALEKAGSIWRLTQISISRLGAKELRANAIRVLCAQAELIKKARGNDEDLATLEQTRFLEWHQVMRRLGLVGNSGAPFFHDEAEADRLDAAQMESEEFIPDDLEADLEEDDLTDVAQIGVEQVSVS